ncbi:MAG: AraC family transcriptional regulator [Verrucomicrobiota bacterium]
MKSSSQSADLLEWPDESLSPAVCRAGYFQFSANQQFMNECVQSRGLYWCKSGRGRFVLDGVSFDLEPHDLYVLSWNRRIVHFPDPEDPMYTGHIHLVPHYRRGAKWIPNVPHEKGELAFDSPDRSDARLPGFDGISRMRVQANEPIGLLMDFAIRWYKESHGEDESEARSLGKLIIKELYRKKSRDVESPDEYPDELARMVAYVKNGFHMSPTVTDLSNLIGRSRSHILKLFKAHLGVSPKSYIVDCQMREARELLLSSTRSVSEVGQAVGLPDPYHFSKLFKRYVGIAPSEFRRRHGPFASPPSASSHRPAPAQPIDKISMPWR